MPTEMRPELGVQVAEGPLSSLLLQVVRAHAALAGALLDELGLVAPQEVVLLHLDDHGAVPQSELVRFLDRDRSTVTATLQALERAGLVVRVPSTVDRRSREVRLTEAGRRLCPRIRAVWAELERQSFGALSEEEQADTAATLRRVRDAARARLDGGCTGAEDGHG